MNDVIELCESDVEIIGDADSFNIDYNQWRTSKELNLAAWQKQMDELRKQKDQEEIEWLRRKASIEKQKRLQQVANDSLKKLDLLAKEEGTTLVLMLDRMLTMVQSGEYKR